MVNCKLIRIKKNEFLVFENDRLNESINTLLKQVDKLKIENQTLTQTSNMRKNEVEKLTEELENIRSKGDRRTESLLVENENLKKVKEVYLEQIQSLTDIKNNPNPSAAELFELKETIKELEETNKQLKAKVELSSQKKTGGLSEADEIKQLRVQNDGLLMELLEAKEKYNKLVNENLKGKDRSKSPISRN